jgi:hypothetical protein
VALCAALSMATACVAVPVEDTVTSLTRSAVSDEAGQAVVRRYIDVNNKASTRRDDVLIGTVETSPVVIASRADFRVGRALKEAAQKPFTYIKPTVSAPVYGSYPMRFVSSAGVSTSTAYNHLGLWERTSAGSPWLLSYSLYPAATVKVPDLTGVRVPSRADLAGLTGAPSKVAADLAKYLTIGSSARLGKAFAASPDTDELLIDRAKEKSQDRRSAYLAGVSDTFKLEGQPVTMMTESGEAIVFAVLSERYLTRVRSGYYAYWSSGTVTAFSKGINYETALFVDYQNMVAVAIPKKGKGKPRILAIESTMVGAGGY